MAVPPPCHREYPSVAPFTRTFCAIKLRITGNIPADLGERGFLLSSQLNLKLQWVCENYASTISHINDVEIPAIYARVSKLEALLASLQAQGLQDSDLQPVRDAIADAIRSANEAGVQAYLLQQAAHDAGCDGPVP